MTLQTIQDNLPAYAKDIKLNFSSLINSDSPLNQQQKWGTLLACAMASKNQALLNAVAAQANEHLTAEAVTAAKGAAALMAMNNIYYRFTHLVSNSDYAKMPANLRMSLIGQPGIDKLDFELFSLAVSALNGCGLCIDSHEKILSSKGTTKEVIQSAIKTASIIHAVATVMEAEKVN